MMISFNHPFDTTWTHQGKEYGFPRSVWLVDMSAEQ